VSQLRSELQEVMRSVFDDDELVITDSMSAVDIDGWDSMAHINLIIALEKRFGVRFGPTDIAAIGRRGQTIGGMLGIIESKAQPVDSDGTGL
jgi:acyl carrier protein